MTFIARAATVFHCMLVSECRKGLFPVCIFIEGDAPAGSKNWKAWAAVRSVWLGWENARLKSTEKFNFNVLLLLNIKRFKACKNSKNRYSNTYCVKLQASTSTGFAKLKDSLPVFLYNRFTVQKKTMYLNSVHSKQRLNPSFAKSYFDNADRFIYSTLPCFIYWLLYSHLISTSISLANWF